LIPLGTGVMFIRNDAATFWYCSSKCRKNATVLKRDPRKLKWSRQEAKVAVAKKKTTETAKTKA
jgi:large subunit ribosomal protein L24e